MRARKKIMEILKKCVNDSSWCQCFEEKECVCANLAVKRIDKTMVAIHDVLVEELESEAQWIKYKQRYRLTDDTAGIKKSIVVINRVLGGGK